MVICSMTQGAQISTLWQLRGVEWGRRWEGGSRGGGYTYPRLCLCIPYVCLWLIHADVWRKPTQYCTEIILQFTKMLLSSLLPSKVSSVCSPSLGQLFSTRDSPRGIFDCQEQQWGGGELEYHCHLMIRAQGCSQTSYKTAFYNQE